MRQRFRCCRPQRVKIDQARCWSSVPIRLSAWISIFPWMLMCQRAKALSLSRFLNSKEVSESLVLQSNEPRHRPSGCPNWLSSLRRRLGRSLPCLLSLCRTVISIRSLRLHLSDRGSVLVRQRMAVGSALKGSSLGSRPSTLHLTTLYRKRWPRSHLARNQSTTGLLITQKL